MTIPLPGNYCTIARLPGPLALLRRHEQPVDDQIRAERGAVGIGSTTPGGAATHPARSITSVRRSILCVSDSTSRRVERGVRARLTDSRMVIQWVRQICVVQVEHRTGGQQVPECHQ